MEFANRQAPNYWAKSRKLRPPQISIAQMRLENARVKGGLVSADVMTSDRKRGVLKGREATMNGEGASA